MPKIHKIVDFWWYIPHWDTRIGHFVARLMTTLCSVSVLMRWGCWGHWGHWGCWGRWGYWGSWWHGNHPVIKVQADFDFLRSLRPLKLSCLFRLLRSLKPLRFSKPLLSLWKWLESPYFDVLKKYFWAEWWNFKTKVVEDRDVISTKSKDHKSNVHISWMCRYRFYALKVHFWWSNRCLLSYKQTWNTL